MARKSSPVPVYLSDGSLNPNYTRHYYITHKKQVLAKAAAYRERNLEKCRKQRHQRELDRKTRVLTHYGKNGELKCCWTGCEISDVDILTLDHVNNDGASQRKTGWADQCHWVERHGLPEGFQTLCWNHQWKKELIRRRAEFAIPKLRKAAAHV